MAQRAKQLQSKARHVAEQLAPIRGQIAAATRIARDQLVAAMDQAASKIRLKQARAARLEASIDEKRDLVEIGLLGADALYAHQEELELARHQLQLAQSELVGQKSIAASLDHSIYLESHNRDLATLELRVRALEREHAEILAEAASLEDQIAEMERLLTRYPDAAPTEEFASVRAPHAGKVVSVTASVGDKVVRGDTVARALDCTQAFAVAVFSARDVADIEIGSPAAVKLHTRDEKYEGHVARMMRPFDMDDDNAFFVAFPEAKLSETYVMVEVDAGDAREDPTEASFGCHIGEPVSVAVGQPLRDRLTQIYVSWRGMGDDTTWTAVTGWQQTAESATSWLRGWAERLGGFSERPSGGAIHSPSGSGSPDGSAQIEPAAAEAAVGNPSALDHQSSSALAETVAETRAPRGIR